MRFSFCITVLVSFLSLGPLKGQPILTEVAQNVGIVHNAQYCPQALEMPAQGGAAWFDFNLDGYYDLYLTGGEADDQLFQNNGNGTFTNVSLSSGLSAVQGVCTNGVVSGHFNEDEYPDLFISTYSPHENILLFNNGGDSFNVASQWSNTNPIGNSFSPITADFDEDGNLDIYVVNWSPGFELYQIQPGQFKVASGPNYYFENQGGGLFLERAISQSIEDTSGCGLASAMSDYDMDGDLDLIVVNDFGQFPFNSSNLLFDNAGSGLFPEISDNIGIDVEMNGMGVARGDYDNDGDFDYYFSNLTSDAFMRNQNGSFENVVSQTGMENDSVWIVGQQEKRHHTGWGVAFLDIDNDLDLDLFEANGTLIYQPLSLDSNKLYLNDGNGTFDDVSFSIGVSDTYVSRALAYCDYDLDGDLDVFVGITDTLNGTYNSLLYRNDSPQLNWLEVKAQGIASNSNGIGVKVLLHVDGRLLIREIGGESSFNSQHWYVAHFGLGSYQNIDSLDVIWPSGLEERYYALQSNQLLEIVEGQGVITHNTNQKSDSSVFLAPNPASSFTEVKGLKYKDVLIQFFDSTGKLVFETENSFYNQRPIDISQLPGGVYSVKILRENRAEHVLNLIKR